MCKSCSVLDVLKVISKCQEESNNEWLLKKNKVSKAQSLPELYKSTIEIFGNSQKELEKTILIDGLCHPFFNDENAEVGSNYIIFYDGKFKVSFPCLKGYSIKISTHAGVPTNYSPSVPKSVEGILKLVDEFHKKKSMKLLKEIKHRCYLNGDRYSFLTIQRYIRLIYELYFCNEKWDNVRRMIASDKIREKEANEKMKEFRELQDNAKAFINELIESDIKKFEDVGFKIEVYGIMDEKGCISFG